ncbi:hypothetical protein L6452_00166 [Arctium lappa]|uniref:Uncharacterized protein n=1 Tax=Arctium lappa TaxID=4217 RepID=A0ACB9FDY4_ARCLA|nr:hypothetical protein L6452_00166 [Arctium lappa]
MEDFFPVSLLPSDLNNVAYKSSHEVLISPHVIQNPTEFCEKFVGFKASIDSLKAEFGWTISPGSDWTWVWNISHSGSSRPKCIVPGQPSLFPFLFLPNSKFKLIRHTFIIIQNLDSQVRSFGILHFLQTSKSKTRLKTPNNSHLKEDQVKFSLVVAVVIEK